MITELLGAHCAHVWVTDSEKAHISRRTRFCEFYLQDFYQDLTVNIGENIPLWFRQREVKSNHFLKYDLLNRACLQQRLLYQRLTCSCFISLTDLEVEEYPTSAQLRVRRRLKCTYEVHSQRHGLNKRLRSNRWTWGYYPPPTLFPSLKAFNQSSFYPFYHVQYSTQSCKAY